MCIKTLLDDEKKIRTTRSAATECFSVGSTLQRVFDLHCIHQHCSSFVYSETTEDLPSSSATLCTGDGLYSVR